MVKRTQNADIPRISFSDEQRSYVIVARTVQTRLVPQVVVRRGDGARVQKLVWASGTQSVVQPEGRQIAQACHATSRMTQSLVQKYCRRAVTSKKAWPLLGPLTRIVLAARDSFELEHCRALLSEAGISVFSFEDTNDEAYGAGVEVTTAIATEPVYSADVVGLISHLPLWSPLPGA